MHIIIAGGGPLRTSLEQLAQRLGVQNRVHFAGYWDDPWGLYAGIDCFVLCSLWEGLPLALLEAAAAGTPVIASRVAGTTEVMTHEQTGLLFPSGSSSQLAGQIKRLAGQPQLAKALAEKASREIPSNA